MPTDQSAEQEQVDAPAAVESGPTSAGAKLRKQRIQRGLSEKEVADRLHITMHYVRSIETDKYEKLPGAVFAKGYIKRYAELLELDVSEMLTAYELFQAGRKAEQDEAVRQQVRHRKDKNKPWVVLSVVVFCGGFAALWAYYNSRGDDLDNQVIREESIATENGSIEPATIAVPQIETVPETVSDVIEQRIAPVAALPDQARNNDSNGVVATSAIALQQAQDSPIADGRQLANLEPITPDNISIQLESDGRRIIEISADGEDVLRISFSGESWVEVNDGDANQIYRDIREAGDVLEITGNAPFNILLGDAPFTRLNFNGDEIDVSEEIRIDNSARLTVGL